MPYLAIYEHLWPVSVAMSRRHEPVVNAERAKRNPSYQALRGNTKSTQGGKVGASSDEDEDEDDDIDTDKHEDEEDEVDVPDTIYNGLLRNVYRFEGEPELEEGEGEGDDVENREQHGQADANTDDGAQVDPNHPPTDPHPGAAEVGQGEDVDAEGDSDADVDQLVSDGPEENGPATGTVVDTRRTLPGDGQVTQTRSGGGPIVSDALPPPTSTSPVPPLTLPVPPATSPVPPLTLPAPPSTSPVPPSTVPPSGEASKDLAQNTVPGPNDTAAPAPNAGDDASMDVDDREDGASRSSTERTLWQMFSDDGTMAATQPGPAVSTSGSRIALDESTGSNSQRVFPLPPSTPSQSNAAAQDHPMGVEPDVEEPRTPALNTDIPSQPPARPSRRKRSFTSRSDVESEDEATWRNTRRRVPKSSTPHHHKSPAPVQLGSGSGAVESDEEYMNIDSSTSASEYVPESDVQEAPRRESLRVQTQTASNGESASPLHGLRREKPASSRKGTQLRYTITTRSAQTTSGPASKDVNVAAPTPGRTDAAETGNLPPRPDPHPPTTTERRRFYVSREARQRGIDVARKLSLGAESKGKGKDTDDAGASDAQDTVLKKFTPRNSSSTKQLASGSTSQITSPVKTRSTRGESSQVSSPTKPFVQVPPPSPRVASPTKPFVQVPPPSPRVASPIRPVPPPSPRVASPIRPVASPLSRAVASPVKFVTPPPPSSPLRVASPVKAPLPSQSQPPPPSPQRPSPATLNAPPPMSPVVLPVKTPSVRHEHASTSSASQPVAGQHTSPTPGTDNAHSASLVLSIPGRIDQAVVNALSSVKLEGCLPHLAKAEILTIEDLAELLTADRQVCISVLSCDGKIPDPKM